MAKDIIDESILDIFPFKEEIDIGEYKLLKYPSILPMMKMKVNQYKVDKFGYIMIMQTSMLNLMNLTTVSFTPSEGLNVPYLLIDTMSMGKKNLAYVEFYNTSSKDSFENIFNLTSKYSFISDYSEKDAWYVKERMKGSLIKQGKKEDISKLQEMIKDSLNEYKNVIDNADTDLSSINNLKEFQNKMISLGNPSSNTLNKVLGKDKAIEFFKNIIMPIK